MELFSDDSLLDDFCKEYNFKENYILHGQCFDIGIRGRKATFFVENSMGSTCYLRCYIINMFDKDEEYDTVFDVFEFKRKYCSGNSKRLKALLQIKNGGIYAINKNQN